MYAETPTKLNLATWCRLAGMHPLHFAGIQFTPTNRSTPICQQPLPQHDWQESDRVSREQIADAINEAETLMERALGYRLVPAWETEEWLNTLRPNRPENIFVNNRDLRAYASVVQAKWGYLRSGGVETKSLLDDNAAIVWFDQDGDGMVDHGAVQYHPLPAGTDACEIEVYYPGHSGEDGYQIRPIETSIVGDTATVTFRRENAVLEDIYEAMTPIPVDWTDDSQFLDEVEMWRHYNDPSVQVTLMWSPMGCSLCQNGCTACAYTVQTGCLHLRSPHAQSVVGWSPGTWNPTTNGFDADELTLGYAPDLLRLNYLAGWQAATGCPRTMDRHWARAVTYLSMSLLERPACDCTNDSWERWREDLALSTGDQVRRYNRSSKVLDNPFGTRAGAVYAWERVRSEGLVQAMTPV